MARIEETEGTESGTQQEIQRGAAISLAKRELAGRPAVESRREKERGERGGAGYNGTKLL